MAATGDATPYIDARISRGETLFGRDQKASLAEFEEIVQAIPGHGLENTELHLTALIGLSVLAFAVDPKDMERHVGLSENVRSEEHTSELQSLMRRSYAVFCLNKKNNTLDTIDYSST